MKNKKFNFQEIVEFINKQSPETKIYVGTDSSRFRTDKIWYAEYTSVVIVHIDGCHGCRIFGESVIEKDFDQKKNRPINRLMNETYKTSNLYLKLKSLIPEREIEVHLDINPDEVHGSSCAVEQAVGYIKGTCNVVPLVKPVAPAATFGADRLNSLNVA